MGRLIQLDSNGYDITCMKEFEALKYPCDPCDSCDRANCEEREVYEKTKSRK